MDNRTLEEVRNNETKLIKEIKSLEKQLDYLRSGEYYNQLRFENEMLQQVIDTNGVPSEIYDYIDCTHRNTELLEENQSLKKQLEEKENIACNWKDSCLENAGKIEKLENQQKKFIEYLENEIDICDSFLDTVKSDLQEIPYGVISANKTYITTRIKENETAHKVYKEILSKYQEIIVGKE